MSALFIYHNLTILLEACNSVLDEIAHAILFQLIHKCIAELFKSLSVICGCIAEPFADFFDEKIFNLAVWY